MLSRSVLEALPQTTNLLICKQRLPNQPPLEVRDLDAESDPKGSRDEGNGEEEEAEDSKNDDVDGESKAEDAQSQEGVEAEDEEP